ncbi:MAG TPA: chemotaxis protein CheX [Acidobacteriaceae bacterium]|nr:chemotaxis protein CheX [Acidobacteriaceae bacterium]
MELAVTQAGANEAYGAAMDEAVDEVFRLMMGVNCEAMEDSPIDEPETISAVIGLAGAMSGTCVLRSGEGTAARMAAALTGIELTSLDDTVKDAVGEICNMVAGAWKGKLPALASGCMLSTPTVVTGTSYQLHTQRPAFRVEHYYSFDGHNFSVTLICESIQ